MAFLYSGYSPFGGDEANFHLHHQSKGLVSNNQSYNSKQGNSDESVSSMIRAEDQKWNIAAARLALSDNSRAIYESKAHNSVNGGGRAMTPSLITSSDNNNNKSLKNMSLNKPNSGTGKNKHKANTNPNSVQNEIVDSMINKILNMDIKQHNHHHHHHQQQQQGFVHDPHALSSQKGILSHTNTGPNMSVNMINSQNTQQGNPNAQRGSPVSPNTNSSPSPVQDKRFKTLPASEILPRNETLGGYIFVCNNDTMQEDLKRQLFGLPQRFRDSVRAIQPGLPLFLYNYTTHQLHGIFEAASFGGSNIDPTAWEDKKNKGESRFPAQVRIRVRRMCKPLEEDAFRPVLFHYDGPKFRLQLSVPETLAIMDLLSQNGPL